MTQLGPCVKDDQTGDQDQKLEMVKMGHIYPVQVRHTSGEQEVFLKTTDLLEADLRREELILNLSGGLRP